MLRLSILTIVTLCVISFGTFGQTNPEPYDLSQGDYVFTTWNANRPAGTYPPNMRFHRGPGADPGLTAEPNADYADGYASVTGTRMNGLGDEGFSWRNTATPGNLGAAVLALNTTGLENIIVSWTGGTVAIDATTREYRIRLQYRVGTNSSWNDVPGPIEYVASSNGHSQNFGPTLLPEEVNNQPVVQLRWKYYYVTGGNTRPQLRVGNIRVQAIDSPGSGTGEAVLSEEVLQGGYSYDLDFIINGTIENVTITDIDIVFPEWAQNLTIGNINLSQADGVINIDNKTIKISEVAVTRNDELVVSLAGFELPDMTDEVGFQVRTGAGSPNTIGIAQSPNLLIWGTPKTIAHASENNQQGVSIHLGKWITIRGVITVADQFKTGTGTTGPSYLQDETGGFAVFAPSTVSEQVAIGDEVTILGKVTQFFGLNQLDESAMIVEHHGSNNTVLPTLLTAEDIATDGVQGIEQYEGMLIRINGVTVNTSFWTVEGAGMNYKIDDGTAEIDIRINSAVDFAGQPAPSAAFDVSGVVSQFRNQTPYIGGYQLMPRFSEDILFVSDAPPIVTLPPYETSATDTSITFMWNTDGEGIAELWYGLTDEYELGKIKISGIRNEHTVTVGGLEPATIYNVRLLSIAGEDTVRSANYLSTTRSPAESTQEINVYFNQSVDHSLAIYEEAEGNKDFRWHLWQRIRQANHSLDLAFYSISGKAAEDIQEEIINAHNRGVQVRVIIDEDRARNTPTGTTFSALNNAGVEVIYGGYNYGQASSGIHHNKFAIIDYYGDDPGSVWLITSSWNATDIGTANHRQNMIEFQDVSIAGAFTREFEQMWGSSGAQSGTGNSKFGPDKDVVNPTVFWIGDAYVRLFFSPQGFGQYGSVEEQIIRAVNDSKHTINLGLNLITREPIATAMKNRFDNGVIVRGVIGDPTVTGSQYNYLAQWADVHQYTRAGNILLHHKYAIFDGEKPSWNGKVLTGSHNWSRAANERNDENTLIITNPNIANLYIQEFAERYRAAGGLDDIVISVDREEEQIPGDFVLHQNYPNPFNNITSIRYSIPTDGDVSIRIFNLIGQEVKSLLHEWQIAGTYNVTFDASGLPSGVYFYRVQAVSRESGNNTQREFVDSKRMILLK